MNIKINQLIFKIISVGTLAGLRSASAPAIASHMLAQHRSKKLTGTSFDFMQSKTVATALKLVAIGELIVDKLPGTPNRIKPFLLTGRCISGAFTGAVIYKAGGGKATTGALIGGIAAFTSTFASFYLRGGISKIMHTADPLVGAIEDTFVVGAGISLSKMK